MCFGLLASLVLSVLWRRPAEGIGLAALVGVVLGYLEMTCARYVISKPGGRLFGADTAAR